LSNETLTRVFAGLAAVVTGVMLLDSSGATMVVGWLLWATGLVSLMAAASAEGKPRDGGRPAVERRRARAAAPRRRAARWSNRSQPSAAGRL
jgi:hypothetical protein